MRSEYDVLVIGAGPAGSVTAREVAKCGLSVLLIEKREQIGFPVRCGEASTTFDDLQSFGPIPEECIESRIDGLIAYGPAGTKVDYYKKDTGVMLNREKFDPCLALLAEKDGAEVVTCARASAVSKAHEGYRTVSIVTKDKTVDVRAKVVVAADGVESTIGRLIGMQTRQIPEFTCCGVDIKVEGILTAPDYLTFWQGLDYINDGYIWSFPKVRSNVTNFGAGFLIPKNQDPSALDITLDWLNKFFPKARIISTVGGVIPVSGNLKEFAADSFVLVGDAAHHTNPLTGGGISAAMRAGRHAASTIVKGITLGDVSRNHFKEYEALVENDFGKKHRFELKFRRFLLNQTKADQIDTYNFLNDAIGKNGKKTDLLLHPYRTAKVLYKFVKFK